MGKMTLDEAKKSPKLDEGAKGTKEGRQFGGPAKSTGVCRMQDQTGETPKVNAKRERVKAGTMNNNRRQVWPPRVKPQGEELLQGK